MEKHPTEISRPHQCGVWKSIDAKSKETTLKEIQRDLFKYRALGPLGCLFRIWDRIYDLFREYGFDLEKGRFVELVYSPRLWQEDAEQIEKLLSGGTRCVDQEYVNHLTSEIRNFAQLGLILQRQGMGGPVSKESLALEWEKIDTFAYQIHLDKNADYSPFNILCTGVFGALVRLWDKVARLLNLYGVDIEAGTINLAKAPLVKNESVEDTWADKRNYGQISLLLYEDAWGN